MAGWIKAKVEKPGAADAKSPQARRYMGRAVPQPAKPATMTAYAKRYMKDR